MEIYSHYLEEDMSDAAMVEQLLTVNPDSLGTIGRERYENMTETLYSRYSETLYGVATDNYAVANYTDAIANLSMLMQMDAGYDEGRAMYLLAKSYEASGDAENAKVWMDRVTKEYPNADTSEAGETEE